MGESRVDLESRGLELPDYRAGFLGDVLTSAGAVLGLPDTSDVLGLADGTPPSQIAVLLVDGLGWRQLQEHGDLCPHLLAGRGRAIGAAFPSTTPVGLATLGTGASPGHHGVVGAAFWLPDSDEMLHPLAWREDPHPIAVQPEPTVLERIARSGISMRSVGPRAFAASGLTRAVLRGGEYRGADSFGERVAEFEEALDGPGLTYCYWGDLDKTGHIHGVDSPAWRAELAHVDQLVAALRDALPDDAVLVVTADHGMVDVQHRVDLDDDPRLARDVLRLGGEPRMRHVYTRPGTAAEVAERWASVLGEHAVVMRREAALGAGLLGDTPPDHVERIGDVLALATDHSVLASDRVDSIVSSLIGQHGSLTPEEMEVPLLVLPT